MGLKKKEVGLVKRERLAALTGSVTVGELKGLIERKGRIDQLQKKRRVLEKGLADVNRQMAELQRGLEKLAGRGRPARPPPVGRRARGGRRKRVRQPSLASLVAEVLGEKKKPMRIAELCTAVLEEKKYKTRAKDFKSQLRILLYKNEKGLFKLTRPGTFTLAGGRP